MTDVAKAVVLRFLPEPEAVPKRCGGCESFDGWNDGSCEHPRAHGIRVCAEKREAPPENCPKRTSGDARTALDALIAAARAEERERCAREAEYEAPYKAEQWGTGAENALLDLATRIRALSGKP